MGTMRRHDWTRARWPSMFRQGATARTSWISWRRCVGCFGFKSALCSSSASASTSPKSQSWINSIPRSTTRKSTKCTSNFLDAFSHLYKRVCPSVRRSVRPSVRLSHTSWNHAKVLLSTKTAISTSVNVSYAVYTALFSCMQRLNTPLCWSVSCSVGRAFIWVSIWP